MSVWVPREASPSTQVVWEGRCWVVSNHKSTSVAGGYLLAETLFLDQGWGYHFLTFSALWLTGSPQGVLTGQEKHFLQSCPVELI